jgi:hypothetical protein
VLHQVEAPTVPSVLLTADDRHDLNLLRLCGFDELAQTAIALAPVASGKRALKISVDTIAALQRAAVEIKMIAMWMLGGVLNELERRCAHHYCEEQYAREWDEMHAAWMTSLDAKLAAVMASP